MREILIGLVAAVEAEGELERDDPRAAVDLMLAAIEGVKIRAGFEPHVADPAEQRAIVDGMMKFLCSCDRRSPAKKPARKGMEACGTS